MIGPILDAVHHRTAPERFRKGGLKRYRSASPCWTPYRSIVAECSPPLATWASNRKRPKTC
jgi:hypothetical protein